MSDKKKVYVSSSFDCTRDTFWGSCGELVTRKFFEENPQDVDLLCLNGGSDLNPSIYGHKNVASWGINHRRDEQEVADCEIAMTNDIAIAGICRGAQLLNALAGGTLVQDMRGHSGGRHPTHTVYGETFSATSAHHQLIVPNEGGLVLAWAEDRLRIGDCTYDGEIPKGTIQDPNPSDDDEDIMVRVTEAIAYPDFRYFGVQYHPEWMSSSEPAVQWALKMIRVFCFGEKMEESV